MCGICGQYNFKNQTRVSEYLLNDMLKCMDLRGPDYSDFYMQNNLGLGVSILKIRDPQNAKQPFYNEQKNIISIFNGEIYNYKQLKKLLLEKNHKIVTDCDAEIICHLYEEYGLDFIKHLNGMFAISLFDKNNNLLFLARDRMGIKPLYYSLSKEKITFSSSLKAIIKDHDISRELDTQAVDCYFSLNYFPGEYTPFKSIKKLLPGHFLIVRNKQPKIIKYWQFDFKYEKIRKEQEYIEEFNQLFSQVVKDQLASDVSIGSFISGGLDSSGLYSYAALHNPGFKTFSVGFQEETFDEQKYLKSLGPNMLKNCYRCKLPADIAPLFNKIIDSLDMPVGEGSYLPFYFLSEFAKNQVTVALSGEGADELFGGYEMYIADIWARYYKKIPRNIRLGLLNLFIKNLPVNYKWMNLRFSLELFLKGISENKTIAHYYWREIFSQTDKQTLYDPDLLSQLNIRAGTSYAYGFFEDRFKTANTKNFLSQAMSFDTRVCLPDGMLHRVDMASMHNSLEVRVPYLDNRIVDFAQRLPLGMKIRNMQGKILLKRAFKQKLPKEILSRRKHGMSAPVSVWIRGSLRDFTYSYLSKIDGIINKNYALEMLKKHCNGEIDAGRKLWNLLIFSVWFDKIKDC